MPAPERDAGASPAAPGSRLPLAAGLAALVLVVAFIAWARIHFVLADRNFDAASADGLLRSDPGLLYYITERIVESGGLPPSDLRADPRVSWPEPADLPAMETVAQEFLVAWAQLLAGGRAPLHVTALYVMSAIAALAALGVYGLAWELTRRQRWAVLAALLYATMIVSYRTLGALLIREDLSLPLYAAHLWLLARAARVRTAASFAWAGLALAAALATWHAMSFFVTLEAAAFLLWFLRSGESPFDVPRAWIVPAVLGLAALVVPVLWAKRFLASPVMIVAAALLAVSLLDRRRTWPHLRRAASGAVLAAALLAAAQLAGVQGDYDHVTGLLLAKLARLGAFPAEDPASLAFDARLLWQGPFRTGHLSDFAYGLAAGCAFLAAGAAWAAPGWIAGRGERTLCWLAGFGALGAVAGWLFVRTLVLLGLLAPALGVALLAKLPARAGLALGLLAVLGQLGYQARVVDALDGTYVAWYAERPEMVQRNVELARLVRWARESLPSDAAVASDYVTSTALLAHNRNPIVCQPKYETKDSRARIEAYIESFFRGTPEDFRQFALRYRCRYAVVDRIGGWWLLNTAAGYPMSQSLPPPHTAAAIFGSTDRRVLMSVPGFHLVYRAPPERFPGDFYRVYEIR